MKKEKFKRFLVLLLAVLMTVSLISCTTNNTGNNEKVNSDSKVDSGSAQNEIASTTSTTSEEVDDGSEVFEYTWVGYAYSPVLAEGDDAVIQRMIEEKYNIKLKPIFVDRTNYEELMNLKFASNEIPDVFTADNAIMLGKWVNQGVIAELKMKDIKTYAPHVYADIESMAKYDPYVLKYTIVNNKNYGLQLTSLDATYRSPVVWRKDWLDKLGVSKIPETVEEFETALYKFAHEDPDGNGKDDTYGCSATGLDTIYGTSGYIPDFWGLRDGKVVWGGIQPEIKEILAMFQKWYKDGVIDPEFVTGENQGGYWATSQPFVNGKIGLSSLGAYYHWNPPYFEDQDWTSTNGKLFKELQGKDAYYDFGKPAVGKNGKSGMAVWSPATGITVLGIQMEKQPKKIQRFLKSQDGFCEDKNYYVTVRYGIEGKNFEFDNHGMIKVLDNAETPEKERVTALGGGFSFMNYNSMKWFKELNKVQFEFADKICSDARIPNACQGSLPSQSKYQAELDKLQKSTYFDIITGDKSIDEFDKFVKEWLSKGGEQLTKEANEWRQNIDSMVAE